MFSSSPKRRDRPWGTLSFPFNANRGSFSGIKWPGREAEHSRSSSTEVKNERFSTSVPHIFLQGVDREGFIFFTFFAYLQP